MCGWVEVLVFWGLLARKAGRGTQNLIITGIPLGFEVLNIGSINVDEIQYNIMVWSEFQLRQNYFSSIFGPKSAF